MGPNFVISVEVIRLFTHIREMQLGTKNYQCRRDNYTKLLLVAGVSAVTEGAEYTGMHAS